MLKRLDKDWILYGLIVSRIFLHRRVGGFTASNSRINYYPLRDSNILMQMFDNNHSRILVNSCLLFCVLHFFSLLYRCDVIVGWGASGRGWETSLKWRYHTGTSSLLWGTYALQRNPIYVFLFWELRRLSPNFHIRVSVRDLYIPRIGPHVSAAE